MSAVYTRRKKRRKLSDDETRNCENLAPPSFLSDATQPLPLSISSISSPMSPSISCLTSLPKSPSISSSASSASVSSSCSPSSSLSSSSASCRSPESRVSPDRASTSSSPLERVQKHVSELQARRQLEAGSSEPPDNSLLSRHFAEPTGGDRLTPLPLTSNLNMNTTNRYAKLESHRHALDRRRRRLVMGQSKPVRNVVLKLQQRQISGTVARPDQVQRQRQVELQLQKQERQYVADCMGQQRQQNQQQHQQHQQHPAQQQNRVRSRLRPFFAAVPARLQLPAGLDLLAQGHILLGFDRTGTLLLSYRAHVELAVEAAESSATSFGPVSTFAGTYELCFWQFHLHGCTTSSSGGGSRKNSNNQDDSSTSTSTSLSGSAESAEPAATHPGPLSLLCAVPLFGGQSIPSVTRSALLTITQSRDGDVFVVHGSSGASGSSLRASTVTPTPSARRQFVSIVPNPATVCRKLQTLDFSYVIHAPFPQYMPRLVLMEPGNLVFNTGSGLLLLQFNVSTIPHPTLSMHDLQHLTDASPGTSNPASAASSPSLRGSSSVFDFPDNSLLHPSTGRLAPPAAAGNPRRSPFDLKAPFSVDGGADGEPSVAETISSVLRGAGFSDSQTLPCGRTEAQVGEALTDRCASRAVVGTPGCSMHDCSRAISVCSAQVRVDSDAGAGRRQLNDNPFDQEFETEPSHHLPVILEYRKASVETMLLKLKAAVPKLADTQLIDYDMRLVCQVPPFDGHGIDQNGDGGGVSVLVVVFAQFAARQRRRAVAANTDVKQVGVLFRLSTSYTEQRDAELVRVLHYSRLLGQQRPFHLNRLAVETANRLRARWQSQWTRSAEGRLHVLSNRSVFSGQSLRFLINPAFPLAVVLK